MCRLRRGTIWRFIFRARGPGGELAGVDGVGPDQADAAAGAVQVPQQRPGGVAVLDGGGGDHHGQQQAHRVHGDVPLAAVHLFRVIPPAAGPGHGVGGADRLGVDDRGGRLARPGRRRPGPGRAARRAAGPGCRHRARRRSTRTPSARAGSPRAGTARRTRSGPGTRSPRRSGRSGQTRGLPRRPGTSARQVRGDDLPLGIGQVTGIAPGLRSAARRIPWACAGPAVFLVFTHQGTQGPRPPISAHPPRHQPGTAPRPRGHRVIYQTLTKLRF